MKRGQGIPCTTDHRLDLTKYVFYPITPMPYSNHECGTYIKTTKDSSGFTTIHQGIHRTKTSSIKLGFLAQSGQGIPRPKQERYTARIYHNPTIY